MRWLDLGADLLAHHVLLARPDAELAAVVALAVAMHRCCVQLRGIIRGLSLLWKRGRLPAPQWAVSIGWETDPPLALAFGHVEREALRGVRLPAWRWRQTRRANRELAPDPKDVVLLLAFRNEHECVPLASLPTIEAAGRLWWVVESEMLSHHSWDYAASLEGHRNVDWSEAAEMLETRWRQYGVGTFADPPADSARLGLALWSPTQRRACVLAHPFWRGDFIACPPGHAVCSALRDAENAGALPSSRSRAEQRAARAKTVGELWETTLVGAGQNILTLALYHRRAAYPDGRAPPLLISLEEGYTISTRWGDSLGDGLYISTRRGDSRLRTVLGSLIWH